MLVSLQSVLLDHQSFSKGFLLVRCTCQNWHNVFFALCVLCYKICWMINIRITNEAMNLFCECFQRYKWLEFNTIFCVIIFMTDFHCDITNKSFQICWYLYMVVCVCVCMHRGNNSNSHISARKKCKLYELFVQSSLRTCYLATSVGHSLCICIWRTASAVWLGHHQTEVPKELN